MNTQKLQIKTLNILDIFIWGAFALLLVIVMLGGFSFSIGALHVDAHNPKDTANTLLILIFLRVGLGGTEHVSRIPIFLHLGALLTFVRKRLQHVRPVFLLGGMTGGYAAMMSVMTVKRHLSYHSHAFDLGIFDQVIWNTLQGDVLYSSIIGNRHFFGEHFSPILLVLTPLYMLHAHPITLLIFQSFALSLGTIPVYLLAKKILESEQLALLFALVYICYQPLRNVNLFDFHPIALATPLLLFALWFVEQRRYLLFGICLVFALLCKEEISTIVFIFGIYIALIHKKKMFGLTLALFGLVIFFTEIWVIIPHYRNAPFVFVERYSYLGTSIPEIIKTLVFRPWYVLQHTITGKKLAYIFNVFAPTGFLSFLSPSRLLLGLPTLLQNVLSNAKPQYSIGFQYTAPLTPFVFVSAIYGLRNLLTHRTIQKYRHKKWGRAQLIHGISVFFLLSCLLFYGRSPVYLLRTYALTEHTRLTDRLLREIPENTSVAAQDTLVPHLSHRKSIYQFPVIDDADYVVLDKTANRYPLSDEEYADAIANLVHGEYGVLFAEDGILILKKGHESPESETLPGTVRNNETTL